jgi:thiamine biosynthesis lipoprotein
MGTLFEVLLRGEDAEHLAAVADAILDEVERIERLLSRFDARSEIWRINRLAAIEEVQMDYELAGLLKTCVEAREWTGGAFDIAAGSRRGGAAVHLGLQAGTCISAGLGIAFDCDCRRIRFTSPEVQLDLGGIGKGYALDRAAELLAEYGVEHALLHGGTSSVLARGCDEDGLPWRIDLPGASLPSITLHDQALSCSAVNEQADILDPATGQPLVDSVAVAVVAASATEAEVLSTALLCMDRAHAETFAVANRLRVHWLFSAAESLSGSC